MKMAEHTLKNTDSKSDHVQLTDENGQVVATIWPGQAEWGSRIVRAVNTHDKLMAGCRAAEDLLTEIANKLGGHTYRAGVETRQARALLQAAIAVADGPQTVESEERS